MSTLSTHLKSLKLKNPWYVEHYGLKHVITVVNYRAEFEQLGIKVIEERFHKKYSKNSSNSVKRSILELDESFCLNGLCDHWHYIIDVPDILLVKAYDQKQNWAKILGIHRYIITPLKTNGCITTQDHYENLMFFLSNYPRIEEKIEDETYEEDNKVFNGETASNVFKYSLQLKQAMEKDRELKKNKISQKRVHLNHVKEILNEQRAQEALQVKEEARRERQCLQQELERNCKHRRDSFEYWMDN